MVSCLYLLEVSPPRLIGGLLGVGWGEVLVVSALAGLLCSLDGIFASLVSYERTRTILAAVQWAGAIAVFHGLFEAFAGVLTVLTDWWAGVVLIVARVLFLGLSLWVAYVCFQESVELARGDGHEHHHDHEPGVGEGVNEHHKHTGHVHLEFSDLDWSLIGFWAPAAILGSIDALSVGHAMTVELIRATYLQLGVGYFVALAVVFITTLCASMVSYRIHSRYLRLRNELLAWGSVARVSLFIWLAFRLASSMLMLFGVPGMTPGVTVASLCVSTGVSYLLLARSVRAFRRLD